MSEGPIIDAQEAARRLLASCPAWQRWTNADRAPDPAAAALRSIHTDALPPPENGERHTRGELEGYRPFALIAADPEGGWQLQRIGSGAYRARGSLLVLFEDDVPGGLLDDAAAARRRIKRLAGSLALEVVDRAEDASLEPPPPPITRLVAESGPHRSEDEAVETEGDFYEWAWLWEWGM